MINKKQKDFGQKRKRIKRSIAILAGIVCALLCGCQAKVATFTVGAPWDEGISFDCFLSNIYSGDGALFCYTDERISWYGSLYNDGEDLSFICNEQYLSPIYWILTDNETEEEIASSALGGYWESSLLSKGRTITTEGDYTFSDDRIGSYRLQIICEFFSGENSFYEASDFLIEVIINPYDNGYEDPDSADPAEYWDSSQIEHETVLSGLQTTKEGWLYCYTGQSVSCKASVRRAPDAEETTFVSPNSYVKAVWMEVLPDGYIVQNLTATSPIDIETYKAGQWGNYKVTEREFTFKGSYLLLIFFDVTVNGRRYYKMTDSFYFYVTVQEGQGNEA